MTNPSELIKENKRLKTLVAQYENMHEKQINPPVSISHVDYKEKYEEAYAELKKFVQIPLSLFGLYRKLK